MAYLVTFNNNGNIITAISYKHDAYQALFSMWAEMVNQKGDVDCRDSKIEELQEALNQKELKKFSFYEDVRSSQNPIKLNSEIQEISNDEYEVLAKFSGTMGIIVA